MENLYLLFLAFLKIFKGMVLTCLVSAVLLYIYLQIRERLHISYFKNIYNRYTTGGLWK
jgi:hypothetical protein